MKCSKYKCPCCENYTLNHDVYGHYGEVCEVCLWQSDEVQDNNPDAKEGFNPISLNGARENYKKIGAITESYEKYVRKPIENEINKLKGKLDYYEIIEKELLEQHSLAAFIFFISRGHELNFNYNNISYSLTWTNNPSEQKSKILLSSSKQDETKKFNNIFDFIENGIIDGTPFLESWKDWILEYLF